MLRLSRSSRFFSWGRLFIAFLILVLMVECFIDRQLLKLSAPFSCYLRSSSTCNTSTTVAKKFGQINSFDQDNSDGKTDRDGISCMHDGGDQQCDLSDSRWGIPTLLISFGRSGSTVTWDTLAALAANSSYYQRSTEDMGKSKEATVRFFDDINPREHGKCALERVLCARQLENRKRIENKQIRDGSVSIYGTKWKPYFESFGHLKSRQALEWLGTQNHIKVLFNKRNLLDVYLSKYKHEVQDVPAHCHQGNEACLQKHFKAEQNLVVPTNSLLSELEHLEHATNQTIDLLTTSNVVARHIEYERLYYDETADEWNLALAHLWERKPNPPLSRADVMRYISHAATSNSSRSETLSNYADIKATLQNTRFAMLLQ